MRMGGGGRIPVLVELLVLLTSVIPLGDCIIHRTNSNHSYKELVYYDNVNSGVERDTISLDNYLRGYLRGPINDEYGFFTHDVIAAYAGPPPPSNATLSNSKHVVNYPKHQLVRAWTMFDTKSGVVCDLTGIQNFGELALFSCPVEGLYQAYARDVHMRNLKKGKLKPAIDPKIPTRAYRTRKELEGYNLMRDDLPFMIMVFGEEKFTYRRPMKMGHEFTEKRYVDWTTRDRIEAIVVSKRADVVTSDPVVIKSSYFCYYWMFNLKKRSSVNFDGKHVASIVANNNTVNNEAYAYHLYDLRIWVAEPTAISHEESGDRIDPRTLKVTDYSKVITNRFHDTGLFPCLRKAHKVIEIVSEITYITEIDKSNELQGAPHWLAVLKIHSDRLISTLSDVSFTIASRQSTGSFHCFVGDTKVYIDIREFTFLHQAKLEEGAINFDVSHISGSVKPIHYKHKTNQLYGHGVQYIGNKYTKLYEPGTSRTDMTIVNNPCIAQEFAMAVGGSLYVAHGFLRTGIQQVARVVLPYIASSFGTKTDPDDYREYQRVFDVAFTPTHVVFLVSDGSVILHSTSPKLLGLGMLTDLLKYRPSSLVKRKWCPKTSTPKYSGMMVPMFSRTGNIIVLHLFSVEGSVRLWVTPPSPSCVVEGAGVFDNKLDVNTLVNETDIHYNEYREVIRTNHITGLEEPKPPERPQPPAASGNKNLEETPAYLVNEGVLLEDGLDPHFPPQLLDPARILIGTNRENYNEAVIYALDNEKQSLKRLMAENGITNVDTVSTDDDNGLGLYTVEFAAVEKQFIIAIKLNAKEIPKSFGESGKSPFQMVITTVTVTNYPFRLKLQKSDKDPDENVDTIVPFPGTILVRPKPFTIEYVKSNDPEEERMHIEELKGKTEVEFTPIVFMMNTAIPSYVINLGDILVYTSLESRYARPLHFYEWDVIDGRAKAKQNEKPKPLTFDDSTFLFARDKRLHDAVVTDQGIISVLWRKENRHQVKDGEEGNDDQNASYTQTAAIGSVISLEGLREVKPFFRLDNVFQRITPDGEVLYGIYETRPHTPYELCAGGEWNETAYSGIACIQQAKNYTGIPYCTKSVGPPCRSPSKLKSCSEYSSSEETCVRIDPSNCKNAGDVKCWPQFAPIEELRSVNFLGTPFLSHLLGSLQSVKSLHPEAPMEGAKNVTDDLNDAVEEPDICPFSSFKVSNKDFDFAEVSFQTRITGEVSYFGTGIPTEADLNVEFDNIMGVVVDVSSSVEEQRGLTTIKKTIDISFQMTDFILGEFSKDAKGESDLIFGRLEFDDIRAREKSTVFSVTIRPSIVNNHCKSTDYFKTVQFNVGCNTFSSLRLVSEAAPFVLHTLDNEKEQEFNWVKSDDEKSLRIPKAHVYHRQVKENVFNCSSDGKCKVPFYDLFKDNIFTVSYRDYFYPKFEQFLTVSARPVMGNMVIYDLLGSKEFNLTTNNLQAGCHSVGGFWYDKLVNTTGYIGQGSTEHENIYKYFVDCYDASVPNSREQSHQLSATAFHLHNFTNNNRIKFLRQRNQILIFRAVVVNTEYNRFTYCKTLETFFLVRVTGIPIPRQGLALWNYLFIIFVVFISLVISYFVFFRFYTWKLDSVEATPSNKELKEAEKS